ncbi:MAG: DnaJ domain-containing protein [Deltaproteobacteria bacterium]|nr:DnaJ domain-containing protein [Deltaproteobacteria bacterium]
MPEDTRGAITTDEQASIEALHRVIESGDYYAVLGVSPGADVVHIRRAYYGLSRSWHPDQFYRRPIGEWRERIDEVFAGINRAYQVLSDAQSRAAYDAEREQETVSREVVPPEPVVSKPPEESRVVVGLDQEGPVHEVDLSRERLQIAPTSIGGGEDSAVRRKRGDVPGMRKVRAQIEERLTKARRAYQKALSEAKEGRWIQAAADMYIASRFDPQNAEYERLWKEYDPKGRLQKAQAEMQAAETALQYHDARRAIVHLQAAVDVRPPIGEPYFQLGLLKDGLEEDRDPREIMSLFRKAVDHEPDQVRFRLALARLYLECRLHSKARREFEEALRIDPANAEAKSGLRRTR